MLKATVIIWNEYRVYAGCGVGVSWRILSVIVVKYFSSILSYICKNVVWMGVVCLLVIMRTQTV